MSAVAQNVVDFGLRCYRCGDVKPSSAFWTDNRRAAYGRNQKNNYCKDCLKSSRKRYEILPDDHPIIVAGRRWCTGCSTEKPLVAFDKATHYEHGRETRCKDCKNAWRNARRVKKRKPPIEATKRDYQRLYYKGVSGAAFKALFDAQDGKCGICEKELDFFAKDTCLDHDHDTNIVRGILCGRCNLGLGHMKDSVQVLRSAIAYLEKHEVV